MTNKRIKILFTISNFHTAGSGKVVYDLAKGLDKTKFEVEIACGHSEGLFFEKVKALGLPIRVFDTKTTYRPLWGLPKRIWSIRNFMSQHGYDIIHSWQWSSDWTEALASKLAGSKWIYTKKAMGFGNRHWKFKSWLADYIITINNEMRAYFPKKKNQVLIPIGIDTEYYNPLHFPNNNDPSDDKFHIVAVANLVKVKGMEVLIEAIQKIKKQSVRLTVVGNNANDYGQDLIKECKNLGLLDDTIVFVDRVSDVRPYLATSDLFVIPTLNEGRKEGMPMALVEAMSMGIPVLGSDITGINFVLKDFKALLFKPGNSDELAQKIMQMIDLKRSKREQIASNLRAYCIENFAMNDFIMNHEHLYVKLHGQF